MNDPRLPGQETDDPPRTEDARSEKGSAGDAASMSILDHIAELRTTLLWALALAFGAAIAAWFFSDTIIEALLRPFREGGQQTLYFQKPMEAFMLKLKASGVVGLFLVFPLILQRLYAFVTPGLLPKEKKVVTPLLFVSTALFYVGVGFCYLVLLPLVIRFAMGFATEGLQPWITADSYFDMAARLCFAFGILFELPMVVFVLSWIGLVDPRKLLKGWRYALVLILVASAVLTPPDIISQVMLAGPVMFLYMVSVLISILVRRNRDRERERLRAEDEELERAEREADFAERRARRRADDDPDGDDGGPDGDGGGGGRSGGDGQGSAEEPEAPRESKPVDPRPDPDARPRGTTRIEEAPDRDEESGGEDPPWVRDDRGGRAPADEDEPGEGDEGPPEDRRPGDRD